MDHFWYLKDYQRRRKFYRDQAVCDYRAPPERVFQYLASNRELLVANSSNSTNEWVSARFTLSSDHLLCLGGNDGSIGLYDVLLSVDENSTDANAGMVSCVKAHSGAVMGVYGVPGQSNNMLSIGGDGTAKLFDMEKKTRISCFDGHETIVRSASFAPDSSNEFATCGRDGKFCIHDRRCQAKKDRYGVHFIPAVQSIADAHYLQDNGKPYKDFTNVPGLTNIIYLDENTIVTSSDKAISGIRFWDPRKLTKKPFRKLEIPHRRESKQIGVASMDVNRFSSSLFVAVTDNNIFEFSLGCGQNSPVRKFSHAHTTSYDVTISASPVSDHLLSGSVSNNAALLYNTPATHSLDGDLSSHLDEINPSFKLEGHDSDITAVSWSCQGTYIVTLDESRFRIWSPNFERDEKEEFVLQKDTLPAFTRISFVGNQYEKSVSFSKFKKLTVSPMKSPFKSPVKKRMRISSACSSPFSDRTNVESPGRAEFHHFCKRQLTRDLPKRNNSSEVEDSLKEKPDSNKKLPRKNIMEFFRQKTIDKPAISLNDPTKASPSRNLMGAFLEASSVQVASPSSNTIKRAIVTSPFAVKGLWVMLRRSVEYGEHNMTRKLWSRTETRLWTITLFSGTCMLYAARVALPICAATVAKEYGWSKTDSGTVLSCFFWGYAITQLFAGGAADAIGGENILPHSTLVWSLITIITPQLFDFAYWTGVPIIILIIVRVVTGISQAFHVPGMASMCSCHLTAADKGRVFGIVLAGSHFGTVLAGSVGSVLLDLFGWRVLFQFMGFASLLWYFWLKYMCSLKTRKVIGVNNSDDEEEEPLKKESTPAVHIHMPASPSTVPWAVLFKHPAFWAAGVAQFAGGNAYFTMFNWLPSYFHEVFPAAKGVVYNVVPSLAIVVTSVIAPYMATRLLSNGHSMTVTRKVMESVSLIGISICLFLVPATHGFVSALLIFTLAMACRGFHHGGVSVNPHDFAPNHTGSVFGIFNAFGAITGFVGVYVAGHILEATNNNWAYVFVITGLQCIVGAVVYAMLGTGNKII